MARRRWLRQRLLAAVEARRAARHAQAHAHKQRLSYAGPKNALPTYYIYIFSSSESQDVRIEHIGCTLDGDGELVEKRATLSMGSEKQSVNQAY